MADRKPWEEFSDTTSSDAAAEPKPWETFGGETQPEPKGFLGHTRDLGLSAVKSAIAVPETLVGLADIPTGGRVGKFLENEGGAVGFRPKQAKEFVSEFHTDQYKGQQRQFQEADGILDKTAVAIKNPSLIANTVVESAAPMLAGGVAGRAVRAVAPKVGAAAAGAIGEGTMMAGAQAEAIRQETDDGLLTAGQSGAAVATGLAGTLFGYLGGRVAQRFGLGDVDTMLARGANPQQVASEIAALPAKSIPRQVIEGAISEGFLEELPQSISEQIIQNLALGKDWSEGVEDAAVMGTLAGMAMGGGASLYSGMTRPEPQDGGLPPPAAGTEPPAAPPQGSAPTAERPVIDESALGRAGVFPPAPAPIINERALAPAAPTPSQQMGLNPAAGPVSAAAALAVDTGASATMQQAAQAVDPETGEILETGARVPEQKQPTDTPEQMRERLGFIEQQARVNGGWDRPLIEERDRLQAELARAEPAADQVRGATEMIEPQAAQLRDAAKMVEPTEVIDVTGRTDEQLRVLEKAGRDGWREAAVAEIQRRAAQQPAAAPELETQPGGADAPTMAAPQAEAAPVADIKAVIAKQIPDMTDGELQQAIAHYGPTHKRTTKLQKELQKRGQGAQTTAAIAPGDSVQIADGLGSDVDGQPGRVVSVRGDTASVEVAGERYDDVPVSELKKQVSATASEGWDGMTAEQRAAVLTKPGGWSTAKGKLNVIGKQIAGRNWSAINPTTRATIERLMQGEQTANVPTAEQVAPQAQEARGQEGEKAKWIKAAVDKSRLNGSGGVQLAVAPNGGVTFMGDPNTSKDGKALLANYEKALASGATQQEIAAALQAQAQRADAAQGQAQQGNQPETSQDAPVPEQDRRPMPSGLSFPSERIVTSVQSEFEALEVQASSIGTSDGYVNFGSQYPDGRYYIESAGKSIGFANGQWGDITPEGLKPRGAYDPGNLQAETIRVLEGEGAKRSKSAEPAQAPADVTLADEGKSGGESVIAKMQKRGRNAIDPDTGVSYYENDVSRAESELRQTIYEEQRSPDFAPSELPKAVEFAAKEAKITTEDLRNALLRGIDGDERFSDGRRKQIREAFRKAMFGDAPAESTAPEAALRAAIPPEPMKATKSDDAPEFTTLKDRDGKTVTVRTADLSSARERMPMFTKDGKRKTTWIHRDNLDPTGEKQAEGVKEMAGNPLFNVITTKDGGAFASEGAAQRELNARGLAETHEVVPAGDVQAGINGYLVRKKAEAAATSSSPDQTRAEGGDEEAMQARSDKPSPSRATTKDERKPAEQQQPDAAAPAWRAVKSAPFADEAGAVLGLMNAAQKPSQSEEVVKAVRALARSAEESGDATARGIATFVADNALEALASHKINAGRGSVVEKARHKKLKDGIERLRILEVERMTRGDESPASATSRATHKDPGQPAEPVTQPVIAEAIQKSARNTDFNPAEAKAWILGEIDKAIAVAPTADRIFDGVKIADKPATYAGVKTWSVDGPKDADGLTPSLNIEQAAGGGFAVVWGKSPDQAVRAPNLELAKEDAARIVKTGKFVVKGKAGSWQFDAAVLDAKEFVSFDVPGDGKFKVVNTVEKLRDFRAKVEKSPGFAKSPDRPMTYGSGMAGAVSLDAEIKRIEGLSVVDRRYQGGDVLEEIGNAIEIARLKKSKDEGKLLDRFKEASKGKDYDAWRAEQEAAEGTTAREAAASQRAGQGDPQAFAQMMAMYDQPEAAAQQPEQPAKQYAGPADVSSRAGQMELAKRAGTIAALKAMNAQLRAIAPEEAWADANIEDAADLDALRNQISVALVRANRAGSAEQDSPLRKRLEEASGAELRAVFDALGLAGGARMIQADRIKALMSEDAQAVSDALDDVQSDGVPAAAETPAQPPGANQPALTGPRRNPAQVSVFAPYAAGDIVTIDGQDWQVQQDMGGWYLTSTGNWRGMHPAIQKIRGMNELIAEIERAATAQPATAEQGDAPAGAEATAADLLTPEQARTLMAWEDLGQRDNVKSMRLAFFESAESMAAKRGAMNYGTIESYQGGKWNIDGTTYPTLKAAKAAAEDAALVRLANDGYVAPPFAAYDAVARTYGYEVRADGAIGGEGKFPGPTIKEKGGRLRVESGKGDLLGSYPATPESLGKFLENFWGAEKQVAQPAADQPASDRDQFTVERVDEDQRQTLTFVRGETVKVSGKYPMETGEIDGISNARKEFRIGGAWLPFGYAYKAEYDEFAAPRRELEEMIANAEKRIADGNGFQRDGYPIRDAREHARRYSLKGYDDTLNDLAKRGQAVFDRSIAEERARMAAAEQTDRERREAADAADAAKYAGPVKMTMDEWKRISRDFKSFNGGKRTVMQDGRIRRVEIVKEKAEAPDAEASAGYAAQHEALMASVRTGKATPEAFKASFEQVVANEAAIKAELSAKTKAELLREGGPYLEMRYANEKKDGVVDAVYRQMIGEYALGEAVTYGMARDSYQKAVRRMVEATDADKLAQYVRGREAAIQEAEVRRTARAEAMANPQTLNDYRSLMNEHIREGKTRHEAFLMLTPEQRIRYDELEAEGTREAREARKRAAQNEVRAAGQTTGGQIIATKHTRDGYDLFVVQLADRLSREDYNTVLAGAKRLGGRYSAFRGNGAVPGFQFRTREDAEAFLKLAGGDVAAAKDQVEQRRDAFADDRSQTAAERLVEMADRMEQDADAEENRDRKANTARRARFASAALNAAAAQKAMARTMRNIAQAIQDGRAKFLDAVRTRTQVEALLGYVRTAKDNELRAKYPSYADQEKRKGEPATAETAGFADFPNYTAFRSDLAMLGRQMLEIDGTKKLGQKLMSAADDVTDAYLEFARDNIRAVSQFGRGDALAEFASRDDAERAIRRSGLVGKAIVLPIKRGQNRVILSPSEAMSRKVWAGDGDKRITLSGEFGKELVEAIGRRGNKTNGLAVPWQFQNAYDRRKLLSRIGIETPSEFRSALREVIALQETAVANKVREMGLAMVGRRADGLDFFPTPAEIADQMVEAADIKPEMAVLEPSAGMGHIADRIREAGAEPDVIEISAERRELLEEKGYHLAEVNDFLNMEPRRFFTYGDIFRAPDGVQGVMVGVGHMGSQRVRLEDEQGNRLGLYNRDEVVGVAHRGVHSGYDRIIMNPPFSDRRDAEHVRHAYTLLRPGGRIVAIMGEGVFFGQDKRAQDFRDWLDSVGGTSEKLPEGSFMDPSLPVQTGVNARMVVIDRPAVDDGVRRPGDADPEVAFSATLPRDRNAVRIGITEKGLVRAMRLQFDGLADVTSKLLERGRAGKRGGVIVVGTADNAEIGRIVAERTGRKLDSTMRKFSSAGRLNGFYDPKTGLTFLVGPNLNPVTATAVMLHEMMHGQQRQKIDARALEMVRNRHSLKDEDLRAFLDRVMLRMIGAGEVGNAAEASAYIVEQAVIEGRSAGYTFADNAFMQWVDTKIGKRVGDFLRSFAGMIRTWMLRNGLGAKAMTVDDFVGYAMAGLDRAAAGSVRDRANAKASIDAWHGSPYRFDRFDLGNVGMGERAQAYGWGLYFASSKEVAEHYRNMGGYSLAPASDDAKARFSEATNFAWGAVQAVSDALENNKGDVGKTVARLRGFYADTNRPEMRAAYLTIADMLEAGDLTAKREGATYKVTIAPTEDAFLLWDKPLGEQPKKVAQGLRSAIDAMFGNGTFDTYAAAGNDWRDLKDNMLENMSEKDVSLMLKANGIAGVKYLDGMSRDGKGGSSNYVVFDDADVEIDDIHFSRSGMRELASRATTELNQTLSAPGKLSWWHKTIGTMYNLAERSPAFRPVFQAAQGFIDDVSHYAADAAERAPKLLPRLETWRDIMKSPISAEDNAAVGKPIFEGTLSWTRDADGRPVRVDALIDAASGLSIEEMAAELVSRGAIEERTLRMWRGMPDAQFESAIRTRYENSFLQPGIVWTDDELVSLFSLTPAQIELYREFRAAVDRSLDTMARADMLRFAGEDVRFLRDPVMEAETLREAASLIVMNLSEQANAQPDRAEQLMATGQGVMDRMQKVLKLQAQGYAPLSRFGKYTVDVVVDGNREYFGLFETAREANKMAERMRAEFGASTVTQGTLSDEAFRLFAGITPESLELFGNMLGLDSTGDEAQDRAFQEYLRLTKTNRSALRRLIHRKGIAGFSEDVGRVLASFAYSNARQTAAGLHMGDLSQAVSDIPKEQGELKDVAVKLSEYIKNPQEEAQAIRGLLFAQYLGGSVASAFVNMTQPAAVTFPWLSQHGGAKMAAAEIGKAAKHIATRGHRYESDLAEALKAAEEDGVVSPQEVHQLMAQARGSGSLTAGDGTRAGNARALASNSITRLSAAWGKLFSAAEQLNRRITFIAAYRVAKQKRMANPADFARRAVTETQFVYSKASKMQWGRGAVGGTLMTFKTYSVAYMELMSRLWSQGAPGSAERKAGRKAVALMLAMVLLMGGGGGLPFMEDAEDLIDGIAQIAGYNFSTKKARQQFLIDTFGADAADFIERGVSGLPGVPLDVSGRLGLGNLIPGTGMFLDRSNHSRDILELLGPVGDLGSRFVSGARKAVSGDIGGALLEVSPVAVRNVAKGVDMAATDQYRDYRGYKVLDTNDLEAALKAIGFQPAGVAKIQDANYLNQRAKDFYNLRAQKIRGRWAEGIYEKDPAKVQEAREMVAEWNADNPGQPMIIRMPDILRRVREMGKDKAQRIADTAPRAMRQQLREELLAN